MDEYALAEKERKRDKKIAKIMKRAAISVGVGLGFIILLPFLPEISDTEKMDDMKDLLSLTGMSIVGYGALMTLTVFFFRKHTLVVDGLMNWLVVPTYGLWFAMEAYKVLAG